MSDKKRLNSVERFSWALLQSFWVGGIWLTLLIVFPTIGKSLSAPILAYGVIADLEPRIITFIVVCTFLQLGLFLKVSGIRLLFKSSVGIGLLAVFLVTTTFLALNYLGLLNYKGRGFLYMITAFLGLFLTFFLPPWLQKQREAI